MDITKYFKKRKSGDSDNSQDTSIASDTQGDPAKQQRRGQLEQLPTATNQPPTQASLAPVPSNDTPHHLDIGLYVKTAERLSRDQKYDLLTNTYVPPNDYNYKNDSKGSRCFRHPWISQYSPWLAYSSHLKGALCKYCVIFPQQVHRGLMGSFIVTPFVKFKDFNESARNHAASSWHKGALEDANNFLTIAQRPELTVVSQMDRAVNRAVTQNREKLYSILSSILFCCSHDIALRGKESSSGNLRDLLQFRIEAGDMVLKDHMECSSKNARYISARIQNDLILLSEQVIRDNIVKVANQSNGFSIIADETADIAGTEQLSIGVRFVEMQVQPSESVIIREEFLGFVPLEKMDAATIADTIIQQTRKFGLNLNKLHGQGYDGCSTMAGKDNGVQARISNVYPKAVFVHCSSHRLNLVVHDLNSVAEVRNTTGTVKSIIKFFRDSPKRRRLVPNIPLLCETRWTAKYKSIRIFWENFCDIYTQLELLEVNQQESQTTRQTSHQLRCAAGTTVFLICLKMITKYSSMLEPVTQQLQAVDMDMMEVRNHIELLMKAFRTHRNDAELLFSEDIFPEVKVLAEQLGVDLTVPRRCARQVHRANVEGSIEKYYCRTIYIPYLDSLIQSLECRFGENNDSYFHIFSLHPKNIFKTTRDDFKRSVSSINKTYDIENLEEEALAWYDVQKNNPLENNSVELAKLVQQTTLFPAVRKAILIALTLPATTCTVERSFSTMRRVKTWLRSTMSDKRLSAICMLSVHREKVASQKTDLMNKVVDSFGRDSRRLQFLFHD